jgi:hypothetical protein
MEWTRWEERLMQHFFRTSQLESADQAKLRTAKKTEG